jgi:hypothetical protein
MNVLVVSATGFIGYYRRRTCYRGATGIMLKPAKALLVFDL